MIICCNPDCNWIGTPEQSVYLKHNPEQLLCPECREVTEVTYEEEDTLKGIK